MSDENSVITEDRASWLVRSFLTYRLYILGLASLLVFVLVAVGVYRLTAEVRYDEVLAALSATSWSAIALAALFTGLSFLALIFYDSNALDYIGRRKPFPAIAVTAFMAYAVGNTVGFDVKGDVQSLLALANEPDAFTFAPAAPAWAHPGQCAAVTRAGVVVGHVAALHLLAP